MSWNKSWAGAPDMMSDCDNGYSLMQLLQECGLSDGLLRVHESHA